MKGVNAASRPSMSLATGVSLVALAAGILAAAPATAQTTPPPPPPAEEAGGLDEIIVTGFRQSLQAALDQKRDAVGSVDVIVAEDIAKFPDQNLAESLQRIPGISIQRDGGEGRAITVRGLGSQFTRVRVNGLETVATSTDGASANRDRAFDFNVFASELFSSIVVHKTAAASLDEGSLGAVVDLNTGNPLNGKDGVTVAASVQGSYNDLSKDLGPRLAGLVSYKAPSGLWGASLSAAYQKTETLELGNNTVRWAQAPFDSVNGTSCFGGRPNSGGTYTPNANCDAVALAFHPRIPRYGEVAHDRERLGVTGSLQFEPTETTSISLDGLYSSYKHERRESWGEVLFRSNERSIDVVNYRIDPATNNLVAGTFNDAWVRTESYRRESETDFHQLSGKITQDIGETIKVELLGGFSRSKADIPVETTIIFDDRDAQAYSYDYSNSRKPRLTFGTSVTDPSVFQLAEIRDRPSTTTNKFQTLSLGTVWNAADDLMFTSDALTDLDVAFGAVYRKFEFEAEAFQRDTAVCPGGAGGRDLVLGTLTCTANTVFGPTAVYGFPVTASLARLFKLKDAGQPDGTTTQWIVPDINAAADFTKLYSRPLLLDSGNNRGVTEKAKGGYLELRAKGELFGLKYAADAGLRYVRTDQDSYGIATNATLEASRHYDDWLPAANLALYPTEDIILRGAVSKVMTRPSLGNLTPGGSADGFNYRITLGNPELEPFRATAYDLAFEWYFAEESVFSVALFAKDIESFPVASIQSGVTYAASGLPVEALAPSSPAFQDPALRNQARWTINSTTNGEGATLKGVEISVQGPFSFLPGFWSNFGGIANATFVDSEADYKVVGPVTTANGRLPAETTRTATLFGLSKRAFNATLYYEEEKFSARVSGSYRSGFLDAVSGTGNVFEGYNSTFNLDASVRYRITEQVELSLEGVNLTDEYRDRFTDEDADRNYEYNHFGRTFLFGVRYKM